MTTKVKSNFDFGSILPSRLSITKFCSNHETSNSAKGTEMKNLVSKEDKGQIASARSQRCPHRTALLDCILLPLLFCVTYIYFVLFSFFLFFSVLRECFNLILCETTLALLSAPRALGANVE